jgi:hypothetical protein
MDGAYEARDPSIEVHGESVLVVLAGMKAAAWLAEQILRDNGIDDPQPDGWYPRQAWISAFHTIGEKVGPLTLRRIGMSVFGDQDWPPEIDDVHAALGSIDIPYHMEHRRNGEMFFDPETGTMREGIGHYAYTGTGETTGTMACDDPYPCEFDAGIIEATVRRFGSATATAQVSHVGDACRKTGDDTCTYAISW